MSDKLWKNIKDWVNGVSPPIEEWICCNPSIPEIHNKTVKELLEDKKNDD